MARRKRKTTPIQPVQISIIKMAQAQLAIDDDDYRDLLTARFGVSSCTHLDSYQASLLIAEFERKGFHLVSSKPRTQKPLSQPHPYNTRRPVSRSNGKVVALASRDELEKIDAVAALIPWREQNGLELFLIKRMGIKSGKVRTSQEAYLAIEGLKKMFENGMAKAYGKHWWTLVYADPAINEYVKIHKPAEWR